MRGMEAKMNLANEVADAVRAWRPGDAVNDFLAARIAASITKMNELSTLREAQQIALVGRTSKALQTLSPPPSNDAIARAAAYSSPSQARLDALELAHERSVRLNLRL